MYKWHHSCHRFPARRYKYILILSHPLHTTQALGSTLRIPINMMKHNDEVVNSPDNGPEEAPWKPEATFWNEPSSSAESDPSSPTSNSIPPEVKDPSAFHWSPSSAAEMAAQLSSSGTPNEKQQFHPAGEVNTVVRFIFLILLSMYQKTRNGSYHSFHIVIQSCQKKLGNDGLAARRRIALFVWYERRTRTNSSHTSPDLLETILVEHEQKQQVEQKVDRRVVGSRIRRRVGLRMG